MPGGKIGPVHIVMHHRVDVERNRFVTAEPADHGERHPAAAQLPCQHHRRVSAEDQPGATGDQFVDPLIAQFTGLK
ncbi:hypothetical protein SDC9_145825 [bioreactor metagenome]|uniref:Uncharacterized protein n=1 Tax=bioreactor metagenome TaxID=1076179 RepID=A0A645E9N1_9ZZZZ